MQSQQENTNKSDQSLFEKKNLKNEKKIKISKKSKP